MSYEVGDESVKRGGALEPAKTTEIVANSSPEPAEEELSFLDHLEELRWHVLRAVASIFIFAIIAFIFGDFIFDHVLFAMKNPDFITYQIMCKIAVKLGTPALCIDKFPYEIIALKPITQFAIHLQTSAAVGFILGFPYAFWEIWRFVQPGLHNNERSVSRGAVLAVSFLFLCGVSFGYFILSPISLNFLANYQIGEINAVANQFALADYISVIMMLTLSAGIMFQLPMVVYFLSKVGIVTPTMMKEYRRHSIVIVLLISAIITPPDVFSQVLIALPISVLYEISIRVSARVHKKMLKDSKKFMES
ncbi:MAG: sec-independent protein translocase protein TatC [Flammeovirgaceae bacterium]|jgi:sec-independent protein translocase protein TatC